MSSSSPKVNKDGIKGDNLTYPFIFEMKTIALYLVVGFCGNIFVIANKQKDASCNYRTYVQYTPTFVCAFFHFSCTLTILMKGSLGPFFFRFLSTCCSDDEIYNIHHYGTIKKICSGMYASIYIYHPEINKWISV